MYFVLQNRYLKLNQTGKRVFKLKSAIIFIGIFMNIHSHELRFSDPILDNVLSGMNVKEKSKSF